MTGRILAVDFGERRIGLALSDPTQTIASPHSTIARRRGKRPPISEILGIIEAQDVAHIVVGLPLTLRGDDSDWTTEVRAFADTLQQRSGIAVSMIDERFSSVIAERAVRGSGLRKGEREEKERVDAAAAAVILQHFLNTNRNRSQEPNEADEKL